MNKYCYACEQTLPTDNFHRNASSPDGLQIKCKQCQKEWVNSDKGREVRRKAARVQRAKHPDRERARTALRHAVRDGKIIKQPCQYCGDLRSQGHHEDYSKPLDVIWVCDKCHKAIFHPKERAINDAIIP